MAKNDGPEASDAPLTRGFRIGGIETDSRIVLAPMAGITDLPFRILCRRYGAGLVFSEMVSAEGLVRGQRGSAVLLQSADEERPVAFQLFGSRAESMGGAAEILSGIGADIVDVNMGCPVRKVVCKGAGSALMKEPRKARDIMRAVVRGASVPVTVKIRAGWDESSLNAVEFARMAEGEGVSGVIVHARTSRQMFGGAADPRVIRQVKEAVSIPVIGNGDVTQPGDADRMVEETGCDGVMIGRGGFGNPWIFGGRARPRDGRERLPPFLELVELLERYGDERVRVFKAKKHAQWFAKGLSGASEFRASLYRSAPAVDDVVHLTEEFLGRVRRPDAVEQVETVT